jgi:hypothetical protein
MCPQIAASQRCGPSGHGRGAVALRIAAERDHPSAVDVVLAHQRLDLSHETLGFAPLARHLDPQRRRQRPGRLVTSLTATEFLRLVERATFARPRAGWGFAFAPFTPATCLVLVATR